MPLLLLPLPDWLSVSGGSDRELVIGALRSATVGEGARTDDETNAACTGLGATATGRCTAVAGAEWTGGRTCCRATCVLSSPATVPAAPTASVTAATLAATAAPAPAPAAAPPPPKPGSDWASASRSESGSVSTP